MTYPWTYAAPANQPAPKNLTPGKNALPYERLQSASNAWGPIEVNRSNGTQAAGDGQPLTLDGQVYPAGFGTHASSEMIFSLKNSGANCTQFTATVGVDDEVGNRGSVVFQVFVDGIKTFDSGKVTGGSAAQNLSVDLAGKQTLKLVVTADGEGIAYDYADWAEPTVTCETPPPLPSGVLDTTFGKGGIVAVPIESLADASRAFDHLQVLPDGKILAPSNSKIFRYNADGSLDLSYGKGGQAQATGTDIVFQDLQPNQGVLFLGYNELNSGGRRTFQRLTPNGLQDLQFGSGGFLPVSEPYMLHAVSQADGRFLTVGIRENPVDATKPVTMVVRRFEANGMPDTSYGPAGRTEVPIDIDNSNPVFSGGGPYGIRKVLVQADGKLVIGGTASLGGQRQAWLYRLGSNDKLDTGFGQAGLAELTVPGGNFEFRDLTLSADNRLVVSGRGAGVVLERLLANGQPDPSFGTTGTQELLNFVEAGALELQKDGKILVSLRTPDNRNDVVGRLGTSGAFDKTFANGGIYKLPFANGTNIGGITVQPDGRILVGAGANLYADVSEISRVLLRLLP